MAKPKNKSTGLRSKEQLKGIELLGQSAQDYPTHYSPQLLESFPNRAPQSDAWTSFICTEFTTLCPKTGQPDFAKIYFNYIADKTMVESKSLKLYLYSFRNHGGFHEDCIQTICDDLNRLMRPKFIEVMGEFTPRGGICIFPYASHSKTAYKKLREQRHREYVPGKYSLALNRIYT